jgi:uncharacterized protein
MIGRQEEIAILNKLLHSERSELLLVTGRRRVGKTYLIRETFKENICFEFIGTQYGDTENQLQKFTQEVESFFPERSQNISLKNWSVALRHLSMCIENQKKTKGKKVIFFDEFPWIAQHKSNFLQEFDYWWNSWASKQNIVVVITGSAASWMIQKVVNNKAGLHNRVTQRVHLQPFTLKETQQFFESKKINLDLYQTLQIYMVMGGIPHYLENIEKGESAAQNINRICFTTNGLLRNEFQNLYAALFDHSENHVSIVRVLSQKWKGLTRQEIIASTNFTDGGGLTKVLDELETCGFIMRIVPLGKKSKDTLYRLMDEFSLFHLQFIEGSRTSSKDIWTQKSTTKSFTTWQGYSFENICIKHYEAVKMALGISGIYVDVSAFLHKGNAEESGFQIDMLLDRADNTMNLCEMKFYNSEITVDKSMADLLRRRRARFKEVSGTKKLIFNTLITTYGVQANEHSLSQIDQIITMDKLFGLERF